MITRRLPVFRGLLPFLVGLLLVSAISSCKKEVPEGVLDEEQMENVLYDYHTAQKLGRNAEAAAVTGEKDMAYNERYFIRSALSKYSLTENDFDRSLEWYMRHSDKLFEIYRRLDERLSAEMGTQARATGRQQNFSEGGDTLNLWQGVESELLSSMGRNRLTFEQKIDTLLQQGDRLQLNFNSRWIYREGAKSGVMQLTLVYSNDSTYSVSRNFSTQGQQTLDIRIGNQPVQAVRGFIYQHTEWSDRPRLLVIDNLSLLRMRVKKMKDVDLERPMRVYNP